MAAVPFPALKRTASLWGPVVLYMGVIFYASAQPNGALPPHVGDKSWHAMGYAVLGVLFVRALAGGLPARISLSTALVAVAFTTTYGAGNEVHQMFVPGRFADVNDVLANAIGAVAGAFACWLWGIISPAPRRMERPSRHGL